MQAHTIENKIITTFLIIRHFIKPCSFLDRHIKSIKAGTKNPITENPIDPIRLMIPPSDGIAAAIKTVKIKMN